MTISQELLITFWTFVGLAGLRGIAELTDYALTKLLKQNLNMKTVALNFTEWHQPIYELDSDIYVDDITAQVTDEFFAKYVGIMAEFNEMQNKIREMFQMRLAELKSQIAMTIKFTPEHIRALAQWSENLGLLAYQTRLYELYHKMKYIQNFDDEEINSVAMGSIQVIRDTEQDKEMFYRTIQAWGL